MKSTLFLLLSIACFCMLHGMEVVESGPDSPLLSCNETLTFYDVESLRQCNTFGAIITFLKDEEARAIEDIREKYKISKDTWQSKVILPIKQCEELTKKSYQTPAFFSPERDPRVPEIIIKETEQMLVNYGIDPTHVDITYDQKLFSTQSALAYAKKPCFFLIFGRVIFWGNSTISYNIENSPPISDFDIAHEITHVRDIHDIKQTLVMMAVIDHMLFTNFVCCGSSSKDLIKQPTYRALCKIHETMAFLFPMLEGKVSSYRHYYGSGTTYHPSQADMQPYIDKINAIQSFQPARPLCVPNDQDVKLMALHTFRRADTE
jgi:hypothetical protein